jgi:pimeloyl-ACP methyl ester carboxylesterase
MAVTSELPPRLRDRGFFWVGVTFTTTEVGTVVDGTQMYVEYQKPEATNGAPPVVMVHGGGGQGLDFLGTPDGRPGWASRFVRAGYDVYVVDRPGHGRAPYHPDVLGPMAPSLTYEIAAMIVGSPPGAPPNTQWPGRPEIGDSVLDQFVASQGPMIADMARTQQLMQDRGVELLERIGPAIMLTHSMGAPMGWLVADRRPDLVAAIVAVEPMGPPFLTNPMLGVDLAWGLTAVPMSFDGVRAAAELAGQARSLPHLATVPTAVVSAAASPSGPGDAEVVAFLKRAGCPVEHIRLAEDGIHGNGHFMMIERNSDEIADRLVEWLRSRVPSSIGTP